MQRIAWNRFWQALGVLGLLTGANPMEAQTKATRVAYHGWSGCYRLANETTELIFAPQIGRVMRYGFIGGANLLWENRDLLGKTTDLQNPPKDWRNYGGDKLWAAPQSVWGWPPDPVLDSGAHQVEILSGGRIKTRSKTSAQYGVYFERIIELAPTGTLVTFQNTMVNATRRPVEWSVWQVTQVDDPDQMRMDQHASGRFGKGYYVFEGADPQPGMLTVVANQIRLKRHPTKSSKIGGDAPSGLLVAEKGKLWFEMRAGYEAGKAYPDGGCAQEIYTNPDPLKYIELELLSPLVTLKPNGRYVFQTTWKLARVP